MPELCTPCWEKWVAWLDYQLPPEPPLLLRAYNARAMADHQEARFRDWKDTIDRQQKLIVDICMRRHQGGDNGLEEEPAGPEGRGGVRPEDRGSTA